MEKLRAMIARGRSSFAAASRLVPNALPPPRRGRPKVDDMRARADEKLAQLGIRQRSRRALLKLVAAPRRK